MGTRVMWREGGDRDRGHWRVVKGRRSAREYGNDRRFVIGVVYRRSTVCLMWNGDG